MGKLLIGLLVVIIILGILAAVVILPIDPIRDRGGTGNRDVNPYYINVETRNATEISVDSVTLNGELTMIEEGIDTEVCFQWGEASNDLSTETVRQPVNSTGNYSAIINGLFVYGRTYYFRAKAYPAGSGDTLTFIVNRDIAIETLGPSDVSTMSVTLNGDLTEMGGLTSIEVFFEWGESPGTYTHTTPRTTMMSTGTFSSVVDGPFTIGHSYYYRARTALDAVGGERDFFIPGGVEVVTGNATMISTLFATLNGELTDLGGLDSVEVYFEWGEEPGSYTEVTQKEQMMTTGEFSIEVPAVFMPGTTYYFRARADPGGMGNENSFYVW